MTYISEVSEPITFVPTRPMAVVTVGGGVVGSGGGLHVDADLRCRSCAGLYPMAEQPRGLSLSPSGATVLPGYTEMCPICYHDHQAGTVLAVEI